MPRRAHSFRPSLGHRHINESISSLRLEILFEISPTQLFRSGRPEALVLGNPCLLSLSLLLCLSRVHSTTPRRPWHADRSKYPEATQCLLKDREELLAFLEPVPVAPNCPPCLSRSADRCSPWLCSPRDKATCRCSRGSSRTGRFPRSTGSDGTIRGTRSGRTKNIGRGCRTTESP